MLGRRQAELGPESAKVDQAWAQVELCLTDLGQFRPDVARNRPTCWPPSSHLLLTSFYWPRRLLLAVCDWPPVLLAADNALLAFCWLRKTGVLGGGAGIGRTTQVK